MYSGILKLAQPKNEAELDYEPGSSEREEVQNKIEELMAEVREIPVIIGGEEIYTGNTVDVVMPHDHKHVLAKAHLADAATLRQAVKTALSVKESYNELDWLSRATTMLKAADLLSGSWRSTLVAATMIGISKTVHQAEIDVAELIDMYRFNPYYLYQILQQQSVDAEGMTNWLDYRPLDGFVLAINPFNFTSIAGNLPTAPTLTGNVVLWKPATSALYNAYFIMRLLQEAGFYTGSVNFIPSHGKDVSEVLLTDPNLGGVHFTGSTGTMNTIFKTVGENISRYRQYPRLVGETGGKNFLVAHGSADADEAITAMIRGAYEYQGQKCSATSRAYISRELWARIENKLLDEIKSIKVGSPTDFDNFVCSIIDEQQFKKVISYIEEIKKDSKYEILIGGTYDDSVGYYVEPMLVITTEPKAKIMEEEIFGPILTVYLYDDDRYEETLRLCDQTSPYGLTGSVFAHDREAIAKAEKILRFAAGNFYVNDKTTGSMIGQQPFGGSRKSGTNDKTAYIPNIMRWTSIRAVKETYNPPRNYRRPYMEMK